MVVPPRLTTAESTAAAAGPSSSSSSRRPATTTAADTATPPTAGLTHWNPLTTAAAAAGVAPHHHPAAATAPPPPTASRRPTEAAAVRGTSNLHPPTHTQEEKRPSTTTSRNVHHHHRRSSSSRPAADVSSSLSLRPTRGAAMSTSSSGRRSTDGDSGNMEPQSATSMEGGGQSTSSFSSFSSSSGSRSIPAYFSLRVTLVVTVLVVLVTLVAVLVTYYALDAQRHELETTHRTLSDITEKAVLLGVQRAISASRALHGFLTVSRTTMPNISAPATSRVELFPHFEGFAAEVYRGSVGLVTLGSLPGGVTAQCYPPGSLVLGLDTLDTEQRSWMLETATTGTMAVQGPIPSILQSGRVEYGITVRIPVFNESGGGGARTGLDRWWGTSIVTFSCQAFFDDTGLTNTIYHEGRTRFAVFGVEAATGRCPLVYGDPITISSTNTTTTSRPLDNQTLAWWTKHADVFQMDAGTSGEWHVAFWNDEATWMLTTERIVMVVVLTTGGALFLLAALHLVVRCCLFQVSHGIEYAPKTVPFAYAIIGMHQGDQLWMTHTEGMVSATQEFRRRARKLFAKHHVYVAEEVSQHAFCIASRSVESALEVCLALAQSFENDPLDVSAASAVAHLNESDPKYDLALPMDSPPPHIQSSSSSPLTTKDNAGMPRNWTNSKSNNNDNPQQEQQQQQHDQQVRSCCSCCIGIWCCCHCSPTDDAAAAVSAYHYRNLQSAKSGQSDEWYLPPPVRVEVLSVVHWCTSGTIEWVPSGSQRSGDAPGRVKYRGKDVSCATRLFSYARPKSIILTAPTSSQIPSSMLFQTPLSSLGTHQVRSVGAIELYTLLWGPTTTTTTQFAGAPSRLGGVFDVIRPTDGPQHAAASVLTTTVEPAAQKPSLVVREQVNVPPSTARSTSSLCVPPATPSPPTAAVVVDSFPSSPLLLPPRHRTEPDRSPHVSELTMGPEHTTAFFVDHPPLPNPLSIAASNTHNNNNASQKPNLSEALTTSVQNTPRELLMTLPEVEVQPATTLAAHRSTPTPIVNRLSASQSLPSLSIKAMPISVVQKHRFEEVFEQQAALLDVSFHTALPYIFLFYQAYQILFRPFAAPEKANLARRLTTAFGVPYRNLADHLAVRCALRFLLERDTRDGGGGQGGTEYGAVGGSTTSSRQGSISKSSSSEGSSELKDLRRGNPS